MLKSHFEISQIGVIPCQASPPDVAVAGRQRPDSEPAIDLDTMLDFTAAASVNSLRFDGVDLVLSELHIAMDSTKEDLERFADKLRAREFVAGSLVAPRMDGHRRRLGDGR